LSNNTNLPTETTERLLKETDDELKKQRADRLGTLNDEDKKRILAICEELDKTDRNIPLAIRRENYRRNHEFLTEQIDERSHQVWMLGSLFVPISFLIFTYTVINQYPSLLDRFLLMVGSLTSYLVFYYFYRRITLLNDLSYDYLHAYEIELGLSAHLTLKKYWDVSRFLRMRVNVFAGALFVLVILWTIHLLQSAITYLVSLPSPIAPLTRLCSFVVIFTCFMPIFVVIFLHASVSYATDEEAIRKAKQAPENNGKNEKAPKS
jgi:hypothetical protein